MEVREVIDIGDLSQEERIAVVYEKVTHANYFATTVLPAGHLQSNSKEDYLLNLIVNGSLSLDSKRSQAISEELYYEQCIKAAKILLAAYYNLEEPEELVYEGNSYLIKNINEAGYKPAMNSMNESVRWLYALNSLNVGQIRNLLYYKDEDGYLTYGNYGGVHMVQKVFRHPLFNIPFPMTPAELTTWHSRLSKHRLKKYSGAQNKYKDIPLELKYWNSNSPYMCGYDLEYSFLGYMFYYRINGAAYKKDSFFKHTQAGIANFCGYASYTTFRKARDLFIDKLSNPLEGYESDMQESYQRFLDIFDAFNNVQLGNIEEMLQNDNARNLTGAVFMAQSLERGSYNETIETPQAQVIEIVHSGTIFKP